MIFDTKPNFPKVLTTLGVIAGMGLLPLIAKADTPPDTQSSAIRMAQSSGSSDASGQNRLNLTPKQQEQIQMIMKNQNILIVSVLTPSQRAIVQKAAQSKQSPDVVNEKLKLSGEQKAKIKSIQEQSDQQIRAVLTPEQLKVIDRQSSRDGK
jgi:Spy/CpxP family protein refolding chaperone